MLKVAIIGYGLSGANFHVPILRDLDETFQITAVVSSRPEVVHLDLPNVVVYPDLETMLANASIDVCVVATDNKSHFSISRRCLETGHHVVVEKPFVLEAHQGVELERLAKEKGLILSVYHCRRWDGDFLTLRRQVDEGRIGTPHSLFSHYDRWRPNVVDRWRERSEPGAGILWDLGAHLIDQALVLLGPAKAVTAHLANRRPGAQATDHFHLVLEHENATSYLHGDNQTLAPGPRFQIHGDQGSFIKFRSNGLESYLLEKKGPKTEGWGLDAEEKWGKLTTPSSGEANGKPNEQRVATEVGCYEAFYLQLAEAITNHGPLPVSAGDATAVISIILRAEQSSAESRRLLI